ncbi:MAG TPA: flavodoxin domain-containing protein [Candidatus Bathyarchaeia archaeon]|nr:flavodoxin domain-containing protein [Candidatus Bathyarchaeia archaeon]
MKMAMVVYYSMLGNTEKIAKALSEGMKKGDLAVDCASIENVDPAKLAEYDIFALGALTQAFGIAVSLWKTRTVLALLEYLPNPRSPRRRALSNGSMH